MKTQLTVLSALSALLTASVAFGTTKFSPAQILRTQAQTVGIENAVACFRNENPYNTAHFSERKNGRYVHASQRVKGIITKFSYQRSGDDLMGNVDVFVKLLGKGNRIYKFEIGCDPEFQRCAIDCDGPSISVLPQSNRLIVKNNHGIDVSPTGDLELCGDPSLAAIVAAELGYITRAQAEQIYDVKELQKLLNNDQTKMDRIKATIREYASVALSGKRGADDVFWMQPMKARGKTCSWKDHPHNPPANVRVPFEVSYPENPYEDLFSQEEDN